MLQRHDRRLRSIPGLGDLALGVLGHLNQMSYLRTQDPSYDYLVSSREMSETETDPTWYDFL